MTDLIPHDLRLFGHLGGERTLVLARFVGDDRKRRFQRVRQIADLRAGAIDDVLIGLNEGVELGLHRLDLGRQPACELGRLA